MIPNHVGFGVWPTTPFPEIIESVRAAESLGIQSAWVVESTLNPSRDCVSILGALATHTSKILIGSGIMNIYTRTPTLIASTAATIDQLSKGRLVLGLGSGHRDQISTLHSVPFVKPLQRMREYVKAINHVLTEEVANFSGEFVKITNLKLGVRPFKDRIPVFVASVGHGMARVAGEVADGAFLVLVSPERVTELRRSIDLGAKAAGRETGRVKVACYLPTFLENEAKSGLESARKVVASYGASPFYRRLFREMGYVKEAQGLEACYAQSRASEAAAQVTDQLTHAVTIVGDAQNCRARIEEYRRAGVDLPIVQPFYTGGDLQENLLPSLRLAT